MSIQDWPKEDRPREKLLAQGADALSDAELLAIFLRVGVVGMSAVDLSEHLLNHFGGLANLYQAKLSDFDAVKGIGQAKYVQLQATLEMARRVLHDHIILKPLSSEQLKEYIHLKLQHSKEEQLWLFYLDEQKILIAAECVAEGQATHLPLAKKTFMQAVLKHQPAAIIMAHNHPNASMQPSFSDIQTTKIVDVMLNAVDICLVDHFIIGQDGVFSMAECALF